jgi:hypothetical protein
MSTNCLWSSTTVCQSHAGRFRAHSIERGVAFGFDWELHGRQEDERVQDRPETITLLIA